MRPSQTWRRSWKPRARCSGGRAALDAKAPDATALCAMAKRFATDAGFTVASNALQMFGGYGYLADYGVEKLVRDLRVHQILEGANEIMRLIVAREMVGRDRVERTMRPAATSNADWSLPARSHCLAANGTNNDIAMAGSSLSFAQHRQRGQDRRDRRAATRRSAARRDEESSAQRRLGPDRRGVGDPNRLVEMRAAFGGGRIVDWAFRRATSADLRTGGAARRRRKSTFAASTTRNVSSLALPFAPRRLSAALRPAPLQPASRRSAPLQPAPRRPPPASRPASSASRRPS